MNKEILLEIIGQNGYKLVDKKDFDKKEFTGEELITKQIYSDGNLLDITMNIRQVKGFLETHLTIQRTMLKDWYDIKAK